MTEEGHEVPPLPPQQATDHKKKWFIAVLLASLLSGIAFSVYKYVYAAAVIPSERLIMGVFPVGMVWFGAGVLSCVSIFIFWRQFRFLALLPLAILVGLTYLSGHAAALGLARRITTFESLLPEYEAMVKDIRSGVVPVEGKHEIRDSASDRVIFRAHDEWKTLAPYLIMVKTEPDESETIRFVMPASLIPVHHRTYMHREDGVFEPYLEGFERMKHVVNTNWCMVRD